MKEHCYLLHKETLRTIFNDAPLCFQNLKIKDFLYLGIPLNLRKLQCRLLSKGKFTEHRKKSGKSFIFFRISLNEGGLVNTRPVTYQNHSGILAVTQWWALLLADSLFERLCWILNEYNINIETILLLLFSWLN